MMSLSRPPLAVALALGFLLAATVTRNAKAGSADATLQCASKDGGVRLAGMIPRDSDGLDLTLTDEEGRTKTWSDYDGLVFISHVSDHVLLFRTVPGPELSFQALPKTMKVRKKGRHDETAKFEAVVTLPGLGDAASRREVRMTCDYVYEI